MSSINHVVLMGNLTRDPELRYTPNGTAVCQVGLGLNRRYRDGAGELQQETSFVEGRLRQESWEDKAGEKRSRLTVVAQRVTFLPKNGGNGAAPSEGEPAPEWVTEEA